MDPCHCNFKQQHFAGLAAIFKDMSKHCSSSNPSFSDTLIRSSEVFADMEKNCSSAPQAQQAQAQPPQQSSSKLTQAFTKVKVPNPTETKAAAAQAQTGSVVVPTTSENVQLLDQSNSRREQDVIRVNESAATAQKIGVKYQYQDATKAAAEAKAAPQVPAIQDNTRIRFPDGTMVTYKILTAALLYARNQHNEGTDGYEYLTKILDQVNTAQSVSDVQQVLIDYDIQNIKSINNLTKAKAAGGTRKRRLKRTLRKRSKRTKKARKRK